MESSWHANCNREHYPEIYQEQGRLVDIVSYRIDVKNLVHNHCQCRSLQSGTYPSRRYRRQSGCQEELGPTDPQVLLLFLNEMLTSPQDCI